MTVLGLGFVAWMLWSQWGQINAREPVTFHLALGTVCLAIAYAAMMVLQALNWTTILFTLLPDPAPRAHLFLSYTKSQVAKYLPGNVMHLASRHLYLRELGLPHLPLAKASLCEMVLQPVHAAITICLIAVFMSGLTVAGWDVSGLAPYALAGLVVISFGLIYWLCKPLIWAASLVIVRGIVFMLSLGTIFALTLQLVSADFVGFAVPVSIIAWLIGFLTPGVPGGIGVREAAMIALLTGPLPADDVLIAVIVFRFVTTIGDLLIYLAGNLFAAYMMPPKSAE
ncbi:hypothetical protein [Yoonia maricola]|nr:hypothetical protein [Yoonia maricola]